MYLRRAMTCLQEVVGSPFGPYKRENSSAIHLLTEKDVSGPLREVPKLETNHIGLRQAYEQAVVDLQALMIKQENGHYILAAGIPWFVAIFGRDSIISSITDQASGPELMVGTIHTLATLQAVDCDEFRDAEPGKIPHEVRKGSSPFLNRCRIPGIMAVWMPLLYF